MKTPILTTALIVCAAAACAKREPPPPEARTTVTGTWRLNELVTDSLRGEKREAEGERAGRRPGGRGFPGGGRLPGAIGRGGIGGADLEDFRTMRLIMEDYMRATERLTITPASDGLAFKLANGSTFELPADGKEIKHTLTDIGETKSKAKWKNGDLVVHHEIGKVRISETYLHAPQSPRMIVDVRIMSGLRPLQIRRVYDAVH